jgi:N-acetylneuraminic acid mutarotase
MSSDDHPFYDEEHFNSLKTCEWQKIITTGKKYTPRTGHECIFYNDKIYLFGGTDHEDRKNDLYSYDVFHNRWEKMIQ